MTGSLNGRRAFVTAGAKGIGGAITRAFAKEGAAVAFNYAGDSANALALAAEIAAAGGTAIPLRGDATCPAEVAAMVEDAARRLGGPVEIAVANVGPFRFAPLAELSVEAFDDTIRGNLNASFYLAHAVVPGMRSAGGGVLLTIGLSPTTETLESAPHIAAYACAKAALASLTRSMAFEYAPWNVRVAMVAPGLIGHGDLDPVQLRWMAERVPAGRLGTPAEVAAAAVFLASEQAAYCSGAILSVGGGWDWARGRTTRHDTIELNERIGAAGGKSSDVAA